MIELEREAASIADFVTKAAGGVMSYYENIPEGFAVPSVYFPKPDVISGGDTFSGYSTEYTIFINFFHSSTELAYELALPVLHKINEARRLIPVIDKKGKYVRITNTELKKVDECAYQLQIDWTSRHPYTREDVQLVQNFYLNGGKI